jgi:hypothetical protein
MRAILVSVLVATATIVVSSGPAFGEQPDPGDIGIFFTSNPTSGADAVLDNVGYLQPFDIYVVSFDVPKGMEAYEFGLTVVPNAIPTGGTVLPVGATDFGSGDYNWIVGTGGVCRGQVGPFVLVKYAAVVFLASPGDDVALCLLGATPSSFANGRPGYLACNSPGELHNFGAAYRGCALINPTPYGGEVPVPDAKQSFGTLKAGYGGTAAQ